jgi:hypothetical protein
VQKINYFRQLLLAISYNRIFFENALYQATGIQDQINELFNITDDATTRVMIQRINIINICLAYNFALQTICLYHLPNLANNNNDLSLFTIGTTNSLNVTDFVNGLGNIFLEPAIYMAPPIVPPAVPQVVPLI